MPDRDAQACMRCDATFTFRVRRHHCRACGRIFCGSCTRRRMALANLGYADEVRVCDGCYEERQWEERDRQTKFAAPEEEARRASVATVARSSPSVEVRRQRRASLGRASMSRSTGALDGRMQLLVDTAYVAGGGGIVSSGGLDDVLDRVRVLSPCGTDSGEEAGGALEGAAAFVGLEVDALQHLARKALQSGAISDMGDVVRANRAVLTRRYGDGSYLIHLCVSVAQEGAVATLLAADEDGVSLELRDTYDCTPLLLAAKETRAAALKQLVGRGVDVGARDVNQCTALHLACLAAARSEAVEAVQVLLAGGVAVDATNEQGLTALHVLAKFHQLGADFGFGDQPPSVSESLRLLLAHGASTTLAEPRQGSTALHVAARAGNYDAVCVLMTHMDEEEVCRRDAAGNTALHVAVTYGRAGGGGGIGSTLAASLNSDGFCRIASSLVQRFPRLVWTDNGARRTPLRDVGDEEMLQALLNAAVRVRDNAVLFHFLVEAVRRGDASVLARIQRQLWETKPNSEWSAAALELPGGGVAAALGVGEAALPRADAGEMGGLLHMALRRGDVRVFEMLCDMCGESLDADRYRDCDGDSPLHVAARHRQIRVVRLLLETGRASPTLRNRRDETPLHAVFSAGEVLPPASAPSAVVRALMGRGADPALVDGDGRTALERMCEYGLRLNDACSPGPVRELDGTGSRENERRRLRRIRASRRPNAASAELGEVPRSGTRRPLTNQSAVLGDVSAVQEPVATEGDMLEVFTCTRLLVPSAGANGGALVERVARTGRVELLEALRSVMGRAVLLYRDKHGATPLHHAARTLVPPSPRRRRGSSKSSSESESDFGGRRASVDSRPVETVAKLVSMAPHMFYVRDDDGMLPIDYASDPYTFRTAFEAGISSIPENSLKHLCLLRLSVV